MPLNNRPASRSTVAGSLMLRQAAPVWFSALLVLALSVGILPRGFAQDGEANESAEAEESPATGSAAPDNVDESSAAGTNAEAPSGETPETAAHVELPQERKPYEVLISVSFLGDASLDTGFREDVLSSVPTLLRSRLGQMWTLTVRDDRLVSPPTRAVLDRLSVDELNARLLPGDFDKVFLLVVSRRGSAYEVAGREWDRNSRTAGASIVRETFDRRRVNEIVAGVASDLFRPIAMIRQVDDFNVELGIRAGEYLAADEDAAPFRPGDYLVTYMRYLDRQRNVGQIQFVPWTFLRVDTVERARMLCHVISTFRRSPLAGGRRRVELMGIAARPLLAETEVTLIPRIDPFNPLVGHRVDVMDRLPTEEDPVEDRASYLTDRGGVVTVPADFESPLRHVIVHSGGAVLASVPFIPGMEPSVTLELPDDTPRLIVEGELQMMQDDLIDIVASRAVIMARARRAANAGRWDDVDRFKAELRQLTKFAEFDRQLTETRLAAMQEAQRLGDRVAQSRIARLCREFREIAETRLAANIIEDFEKEMDELQTTNR